jgi:hypothetical protein
VNELPEGNIRIEGNARIIEFLSRLSELFQNEIRRPATDEHECIAVGAQRGHDLSET